MPRHLYITQVSWGHQTLQQMLLGFRFKCFSTLNSQGGDHGFESRMRYQEIEPKKHLEINLSAFYFVLLKEFTAGFTAISFYFYTFLSASPTLLAVSLFLLAVRWV